MASRAIAIPVFYRMKADFELWLTSAKPGDVFEYAVGPSLDARHETAALAAELARTGEVVTHIRRDGAGKPLIHIAKRIRRMEIQALPRRIRRDEEWEASDAGRVFLALVRHANMGLRCPTNGKLAEVTGLRDAEAARYVFNGLVKDGRIAVRSEGQSRVVTVVETGRSTALPTKAGAR